MIAQTIIAVSGLLALVLALDARQERRKWAPVIGLIGQPFWLVETWGGQWGMFLLTVAYTVVWINAFWKYWVRKEAA
jgi:hypothetical protein